MRFVNTKESLTGGDIKPEVFKILVPSAILFCKNKVNWNQGWFQLSAQMLSHFSKKKD